MPRSPSRQSALAVASLAVQANADVEMLGVTAPLSLYALTIAESGEPKTSCDRRLMEALREHERTEAGAHSTNRPRVLEPTNGRMSALRRTTFAN